jgi:hypothetical protein
MGKQGCCKVPSAACRGAQKRRKEFLRGPPAPRQKAAPFAIPFSFFMPDVATALDRQMDHISLMRW